MYPHLCDFSPTFSGILSYESFPSFSFYWLLLFSLQSKSGSPCLKKKLSWPPKSSLTFPLLPNFLRTFCPPDFVSSFPCHSSVFCHLPSLLIILPKKKKIHFWYLSIFLIVLIPFKLFEESLSLTITVLKVFPYLGNETLFFLFHFFSFSDFSSFLYPWSVYISLNFILISLEEEFLELGCP